MNRMDRPGAGVRAALVVAALGVVFGDIGTSPLYALKAVFALDGGLVAPTPANVLGVVSMVFWAIVIIVSVKYVGFILRADDDGEGGVMALAHLVQRALPKGSRWLGAVGLLGVVGGGLFFGDSLITPAISVLSALEGLESAVPATRPFIVPVAAIIVIALFALQRFGTHRVGRLFGPVMALWFTVIGVLGALRVIAEPSVLIALSPHHAVLFAWHHPVITFVAMSAIVLAVTGAEALYADMGHFGRQPIVEAWFALVFPTLTLNYLGQAQLVLSDPTAIDDPFFRLAPSWAQLPLVGLATCATVIASQAVIAGAFSIARQAERLGYLPRLLVRQTSREAGGQIYIAGVNWIMAVGVLVLLLSFRESSKLAVAYGVAVTAMLMLTTILFSLHARLGLRWAWWKVLGFGASLLIIEGLFFAANVAKVLHGGWLTLLVAAAAALIMTTWHRGRSIVSARRERLEGSLPEFLRAASDVHRVSGTAVYLHHNEQTTPLALKKNLQFNRVLHERVIIVTVESSHVAHVPVDERTTVSQLGPDCWHVTLNFGFFDRTDVPAGLAAARDRGLLEAHVGELLYVISRITLERGEKKVMPGWRKRLFTALARASADPTRYYALPVHRTVVLGARVRV